MKSLYLKIVFFAFFGFLAFGHPGELEEIDYFLFLPNSGDRFMNEPVAMIQLDNAARYLKGRNLIPGQIHVHGYAAAAKNDIKPMDLSMERALFVISELQKRGLASDLFSAPAAHGEVDLWGNNTTEAEKNPNRRVILLLDYYFPPAVAFIAGEGAVKPERPAHDSSSLFWIIIILLLFLLGIALIAAHFFLASQHKEKSTIPPQSSGLLNPRHESSGEAVKKQDECNAPIPLIPAPAAIEEPLIADIMTVDLAEIFTAANDITDTDWQKTAALNLNAADMSDDDEAKKDKSMGSKFMDLESVIREVISNIPLGMFFDVHTIVEKLLQEHDDVYLTNVGNYTSAAHYHSRISSIIGHHINIVEKAGNSYSKNIHDKFNECHLFRRKM